MIKAIKLEQFQGYGKPTIIPFGLKTILKGENDSGKSTIRQALEVFSPTHSLGDNQSLINYNSSYAIIVLYLDNNYNLKATLQRNSTSYYIYQGANLLRTYNSYNDEIGYLLGLATTDELLINCLHSTKIFLETSPKVNAEIIKSISTIPHVEEKIYNISNGLDELNKSLSIVRSDINSKSSLLRQVNHPIQELEQLVQTYQQVISLGTSTNSINNYIKIIIGLRLTQHTHQLYTQQLVLTKFIKYAKLQMAYKNNLSLLSKAKLSLYLLIQTRINILKNYKHTLQQQRLAILFLRLSQTTYQLKQYNSYRNALLLYQFVLITQALNKHTHQLYFLLNLKRDLYLAIKRNIKEYCPKCGYVLDRR